MTSVKAKLRFIYGFLDRRLKFMFALCFGMFLVQALWETAIFAAIAGFLAALINSSGQSLGPLAGFFQGLPVEARTVTGFVIMALAMFFKNLIGLGVLAFRTRFSTLFIYGVRRETYARLLRNDMLFFDNNRKGVLIQMVVNETRSAYSILKSLQDIVISVLTLLACFGAMLFLSWFLTLVAVAGCVAVGFFVRYLSRQIRKYSSIVTEKTRALTSVAEESVGGIRQVKLLGLYAYQEEKFNSACWDADFSNRTAALLNQQQGVLTALMGVFVFAGLAIINWRTNALPMALFLTFLYIIRTLISTMTTLNQDIGFMHLNFPVMEKIMEFFDTISRHQEKGGAVSRTPLLADHIHFERVSLDYGKGPVLHDIELEIRRGEKVALVGESGSGKTSLASLLSRLYDPSSGKVTFDGIDLRDIDLETLRRRIGVVNQEPVVFNRSIRDNIMMAEPTAGDQAVRDAIRRACAHEFIAALPEGDATIVGDRGVKLSGGQRQRLNIAQIFLKRPEILVFDEATSALDSRSEHHIQQALVELEEGRTVLVIAHRLSTVRTADKIVVLSKGRIAEEGTWEELMVRQGLFADMVRRQTFAEA